MPTITSNVLNYALTLLASSSSLVMSSSTPSHYQYLTNATIPTLIENLNITTSSLSNVTRSSGGMLDKIVGGFSNSTTPSPLTSIRTTVETIFPTPTVPPPLSYGIIFNDTGGMLRANMGYHDDGWSNKSHNNNIINNGLIQATFCILYTNIFVLGIFGNVLVCYVVFRNKAMQTVTNMFIANLALSDILLCVLAVPFTPLYTFLRGWIFGTALCHIVPYAQGCSVYISTLTLTSIAVDRFFVIIYPFHPRMQLSTCVFIIISIWVISLLITTPYGLYVKLYSSNYTGKWTVYCEENWPDEDYRRIFGAVTSSLQFLFPFLIILICYVCVSIKLNDRANTRPGSRNSRREEIDRDRKKRTNRMLIAMVAIFGISWLPINVVNIFYDFYSKSDEWEYYMVVFFIAHCAAMSSACYNPFLYAWLNEMFRKEFKQVLPCFKNDAVSSTNSDKERQKLARVCNGCNETQQETLNQSQNSRYSSNIQNYIVPRGPTANDDYLFQMRYQKKNNATNDDNANFNLQPPSRKPSPLTTRTSVDDILLSDVAIPSTSTFEITTIPSNVLETPFATPLIPIQSSMNKINGTTCENINNSVAEKTNIISGATLTSQNIHSQTNADIDNNRNNTTKLNQPIIPERVAFSPNGNNGLSKCEMRYDIISPSTSTSVSTVVSSSPLLGLNSTKSTSTQSPFVTRNICNPSFL